MENFKQKFDNLLIDTLCIHQEDIKPEAHFTSDLGADSLDLVEFTMKLEKEFNITIPDDDVEQLITIGDAMKYIKSKIA